MFSINILQQNQRHFSFAYFDSRPNFGLRRKINAMEKVVASAAMLLLYVWRSRFDTHIYIYIYVESIASSAVLLAWMAVVGEYWGVIHPLLSLHTQNNITLGMRNTHRTFSRLLSRNASLHSRPPSTPLHSAKDDDNEEDIEMLADYLMTGAKADNRTGSN